jgi:flavin-dependent dehydrogenase
LQEPDALQCFVDRDLAPGYIAWLLQGVDHLQAGLARREQRPARALKPAMLRFLTRIVAMVPLAGHKPEAVRAGPIPCGGPVWPLSTCRALLVGDAAGLVSPLTGGGIHTALHYGLAAGHAVADFLEGRSLVPAGQLVQSYPRFRAKRMLRLAFDRLQSDWMFNALLSTRFMRHLARRIYFHR